MEDNKRKLYDALSQDYDLGSFEQFSNDIADETKRRKLYDATSEEYDYGDFDTFSSQLGFGKAAQPAVTAPEPPAPSTEPEDMGADLQFDDAPDMRAVTKPTREQKRAAKEEARRQEAENAAREREQMRQQAAEGAQMFGQMRQRMAQKKAEQAPSSSVESAPQEVRRQYAEEDAAIQDFGNLSAELDGFNERLDAFNEKSDKVSKGKLRLSPEEFAQMQKEGQELANIAKRYDTVMKSAPGQEYKAISERLDALAKGEKTPESAWEYAQEYAKLQRNPVFRAAQGENSASEDEINAGLLQGQIAYLDEKMKSAKGNEKKELKKAFSDVKEALYANPWYRKQIKANIAENRENNRIIGEERAAYVQQLRAGYAEQGIPQDYYWQMEKGDKELQMLDAAAHMHDDAIREYEKPTKYDETKGRRNVAKGLGDWASDTDTWSFGIESFVEDIAVVRPVLEKVEKIVGNLNPDLITDSQIDELDKQLTNGEAAVLDAYFDKVAAVAAKGADTAIGYQIGQGIGDMVTLGLEMIATGGVGGAVRGAFEKGSKKALVKVLGKRAYRKVARSGAGKVALWASAKIPADIVETAVRMPFMPSTYKNLGEKAVTLDEGYKTRSFKEYAPEAAWDQFVEQLTEVSNGFAFPLMGKIVKTPGMQKLFKETLGENGVRALRSFMERGDIKLLDDAMLGSFGGEWEEELLGAVIHSVTDDPKALSDFFSAEQQLVLLGTLAPLPISRGAVGGVQLAVPTANAAYRWNRAEAELKRLGLDEGRISRLKEVIDNAPVPEAAREIMNAYRDTYEGMWEAEDAAENDILRGTLRAAGAGPSSRDYDESSRRLYGELARYFWAAQQKRAVGLMQEVQADQKVAAKRAELEQNLGGTFYHPLNGEDVVEIGTITAPDGSTRNVYITSEDENSNGELAYVAEDGSKGFARPDEISDSRVIRVDEYLAGLVMQDAQVQEVQGIARDAAAVNQSLRQQVEALEEVTYNGQKGTISRASSSDEAAVFVPDDGENVVVPWEELAAENGIAVPEVTTQEEKTVAGVDAVTARFAAQQQIADAYREAYSASGKGLFIDTEDGRMAVIDIIEDTIDPDEGTAEFTVRQPDGTRNVTMRTSIERVMAGLQGEAAPAEEPAHATAEEPAEEQPAEEPKEEVPKIPVDKNGEKIYDAPGVSVEDALEDIYTTEGITEEMADEYIRDMAAEAEKGRNPKRGKMNLAEWGRATAEANRKADFWKEMKEFADANTAEREREQKEEAERQERIKQYGVDPATFDMTPQTVEEAVAEYLGNSEKLIDLDDAIRETLGRRKDNRVPRELFRHLGNGGILVKNGGRSVQDVANDIVGEYENTLSITQDDVRTAIIDALLGKTKTELRETIFNNRLEEARRMAEHEANEPGIFADPLEEEYGPVVSTFGTKNGTMEVRKKTYDKDGIRVTKVSVTRNGRGVSTNDVRSAQPIPEGLVPVDIPEEYEVFGYVELREDVANGKKAATVLVKHEDGVYDRLSTRLVPAETETTPATEKEEVAEEPVVEAPSEEAPAPEPEPETTVEEPAEEPVEEPEAPAAPVQAQPTTPEGFGAGNKIFTKDAKDKARETILRKLKGQLNAGIDPEMLTAMIQYCGYYIEAGVRAFTDFAKAAIADLGDAIRPYLKSMYNAVRDYPDMGEIAKEMTPYDEVAAIDVNTIGNEEAPVEEVSEQPAEEAKDVQETEIEKFARENFVDIVKLSFDDEVEARGIFYTIYKSKSGVPGRTRQIEDGFVEDSAMEYRVSNRYAKFMIDHGSHFTFIDGDTVYSLSYNDGNISVAKYYKGKLENPSESTGNSVTLEGEEEAREKFTDTVANRIIASIASGERPYKSITDLRMEARKAGLEVDERGATDILLQELTEVAIVRAARKFMSDFNEGLRSRNAFNAICKLYEMQPTISMRSSQRVSMQQYSTPLPMSFVAQMFAYQHPGQVGDVLEPTAGNGMLLFGIPAKKIHANELDATRKANLDKQGFKEVTQNDATEPFSGEYQAVVANPPFGSHDAVEFDGKKISGLDPVITLRALDAMDNNGRAAIIIGGNVEWGDNGGWKTKKAFFSYLYDHYNVKGVVNMAGDLYAKQGTSYPTMMILIDGKRSESDRTASTVYPPVRDKARGIATTNDELFDLVTEILNDKRKTDGNEVLRSAEHPSLFEPDDTSGEVDESRRPGQPRKSDEGVERERGGLDGGHRTSLGQQGRDDSGRGRESGDAGERGGDAAERGGSDERMGGEERPGADAPRLSGSGEGADRSPEGGDRGSRGGVARDDSRGGNAVREPVRVARKIKDKILSYIHHSGARSLESVAPAAMVEDMDASIQKIEKELGRTIDDFVTEELGYNSTEELHKALAAEQIDSVAMAIYQMKQGKAMIIGDQTGVGKGRQMAALIRWANRQGKKPIFMTQKAGLFSDIYRDLRDIGNGDLKPLILNSVTTKTDEETGEKHFADTAGVMLDEDGNLIYQSPGKTELNKIVASGKVPDEYDFVVLTYSQLNTGDSQSLSETKKKAKDSKQTQSGMAKAAYIRKIATDNYVLLDESHTAAGEGSNSGAFLRSVMPSVKGVTFSSATFAKRPDTMPLYAIKSAMSEANVEPNKLIAMIKKGGVTLQEIMARALTKSGQMVRRERDMSDVKTDWKTVDDPATAKKARANYDRAIEIFNKIIQFQRNFITPVIDDISRDLAEVASSAGETSGTKNFGVDNPPFVSQTYNFTKQLMLALKAEAIVDEVVKEIKAGRHPVIALENTYESGLDAYAVGDKIEDTSFSAGLLRSLGRILQYTVTDQDGNKSQEFLTPEELGPEAAKQYYALQDEIREATKGIFLSPLDLIKERLTGMGYNVGEVTGRKTHVVKEDDGYYRRERVADAKQAVRDFNSGASDVIIINKYGSTGISLHSSVAFKDQRPRSMIIAQPLGDINDYMQMIGRIDRTGQVHRGYYINLSLPVPAELRFNMMLASKLKSLNANTTTSQESDTGSVEAPDFLNKYGSQVVIEYLRDNPDVFSKLVETGMKLGNKQNAVTTISELENYRAMDEDVQKVTGRIALLPVEEQEKFYADISERYNTLIKYLDETGENTLKITTLPLKAKTLARRVGTEGKDPGGNNPFAQNSYVERVEVDVLRKPMKADEIRKVRETLTGGKEFGEYRDGLVSRVNEQEKARLAAEEERYNRDKEKTQKEIDKQIAALEAKVKNMDEVTRKAEANRITNRLMANLGEKHQANVASIKSMHRKLREKFEQFNTNETYLVYEELEGGNLLEGENAYSPALFCGFKTAKVGENLTPSTSVAVFATLDGRRRLEIKFTSDAILDEISRFTNQNYWAAKDTTIDNWDSSISNATREERYVLTGNILQAWDDATKEGVLPGRLVSYTDVDGNIKDGILMNQSWQPTQLRSSGAPINSRTEQILNGEAVRSTDGEVEIEHEWGDMFSIYVPKTKKAGAKYFENEDILSLIFRRQGFHQHRGRFTATVTRDNMRALLNILGDMGVRVNTEENESAWEELNRTGENLSSPIDRARAITTIDGIAKKLGVEFEQDSSLKAKGAFNPKTGKIRINIDAHKDTADLEATLLHEAVAHYGLRKLFGKDWRELRKQLYERAAPEIKAKVDAIAKADGLSTEVAMEEYIAQLAEDGRFDVQEESFWQRIVTALKRLLAKIGINVGYLTDEDFRAMLYASYRNLETRGAIEQAQRVAAYRALRMSADLSRNNANFVENRRNDRERTSKSANDLLGREDDLRGVSGGVPGYAEGLERNEDFRGIRNLEERLRVLRGELGGGRESADGGRADDNRDYGGGAELENRREAISNALIEAAKESGQYIDYSEIRKRRKDLVSGHTMESDVYYDAENDRYIKVRNPFASARLTGNDDFDILFHHIIHNLYFPTERYEFLGITQVPYARYASIVLAQKSAGKNAKPSTWKDMHKWYKDNGFVDGGIDQRGVQWFKKDGILVCDLGSKNLLVDENGGLHPVDPCIRFDGDPRDIFDPGEDMLNRDSNFQKWFKNSKVVDENGEPLVVYHGSRSTRDFSVFDYDADTDKATGSGEIPAFFFSDEETAGVYKADVKLGTLYEGEGRMVPAYLSIQNPAEIDYEGANFRGVGLLAERYNYLTKQWEPFTNNGLRYFPNEREIISALRKRWPNRTFDLDVDYRFTKVDAKPPISEFVDGINRDEYDGAIIRNIDEVGKVTTDYVVFNSNQIKSAFGNNGEYSAEDPDIYHRNLSDLPEETRDLAVEQETEELYRRNRSNATALTAAEAYNSGVRTVGQALREVAVDEYAPVDTLAEALANESGKRIKDNERVSDHLREVGGKAMDAIRDYDKRFLRPMWDAVASFRKAAGDISIEDTETYIGLKSGLERNEVFAKRDAKRDYQQQYEDAIDGINAEEKEKKKALDKQLKTGAISDVTYQGELTLLQQEMNDKRDQAAAIRDAHFADVDAGTDERYAEYRKKDYSAITAWAGTDVVADAEALAADHVDELERAAGASVVKEMWKRVNAATKETLKFQYEHDMLTRDQYRDISKMLNYYVPMRGFAEDTAEDLFNYYVTAQSNDFQPTILSAKGRHTMYEGPLGNIGAMHSSAISQGMKNQAKLALLNLVRNRKGNTIATITRAWFVKTGQKDAAGNDIYEVAYPDVPENATFQQRQSIIERFEEDMKQLKAQGDAYNAHREVDLHGGVVAFEKESHKNEHIVQVREGGKEYGIIINGNPAAAQAINGVRRGKGAGERFLGIMRNWTRMLSQMFTTFSVPFWVSNFQRDFGQGLTNTFIRNDKEYLGKYLVNYARAFKVFPLIIGKNTMDKALAKGDPVAQLYQQYLENGGPMGQTRLEDNEYFEKQMQRYLDNSVKTGIIKGVTGALEAIGRVGEAVETVTRFAVFMTSMQSGRPLHQSIADAKEVSTNFARKGSGRSFTKDELDRMRHADGRPLNSVEKGFVNAVSIGVEIFRATVPFFNAAVQGLENKGVNYSNNFGKTLLADSIYFMAGLGMMLLRSDDGGDDDKEKYSHTSDYLRRNNFLVGLGDGLYGKWALPQEYRVCYSLGDIVGSAIKQQRPVDDLAIDAFGALMQLSPTGVISDEVLFSTGDKQKAWENLVVGISPGVVAPVFEAIFNRDFKGARLYNEGFNDNNRLYPGWTKALNTTGEEYVKAAETLNKLQHNSIEGLHIADDAQNRVERGLVNLNPAIVEHLVESYFSGPYQIVVRIPEAIGRAVSGKAKVRDIPLLNRLLLNANDNKRDAYYSNMYYYFKGLDTEASRIYSEYRKTSPEHAKEMMGTKDYQYMLIFKKYDKMEKQYRKRGKTAENEGDIETKNQMDEKIQSLHEQIAKECLDIYFDRDKVK